MELHCPQCNYELPLVLEGHCPECGTQYTCSPSIRIGDLSARNLIWPWIIIQLVVACWLILEYLLIYLLFFANYNIRIASELILQSREYISDLRRTGKIEHGSEEYNFATKNLAHWMPKFQTMGLSKLNTWTIYSGLLLTSAAVFFIIIFVIRSYLIDNTVSSSFQRSIITKYLFRCIAILVLSSFVIQVVLAIKILFSLQQ